MGKLKNWYIDDNQEDDNRYDYEDEVNKEDLKFMNINFEKATLLHKDTIFNIYWRRAGCLAYLKS